MNRLLLAAAVLCPAVAGAATLEALSAKAGRSFLETPASVRAQVRAEALLTRAPGAQAPVLLTPSTRPLKAGERFGAELGRVNLGAQLDRNLALLRETLGSRLLDVGIATDPGAKTRFLTFTDASGTTLGKIGSLGGLRGSGIDVRIDASTVYNFRVEVGSIFNDPVRNSVLYTTPAEGTSGPSYDMKTGALLDLMRAKSAIVDVDGDDYEIFYGRDARTDGGGFADTRSFLFTHEAGLSTKAWPLSESALPVDAPTVVTLGGVQVQMTRTSGGELVVNSAD